MGLAVIGPGLSKFAYYQYSISVDTVMRSAEAAEVQATAAIRVIYAAEVQAGLMTPEEFNQRPKKNK